MIRIKPEQVTAEIRALFRNEDMQATRCFVTLDGITAKGKIIVDNLTNAKWGVVQEAVDNDVFIGGSIDVTAFKAVFDSLISEGDIIIGMEATDPRIQCLPPYPDYDGFTLEFCDRQAGEELETYIKELPPDCQIVRLDRDLIMRTIWGPNDVRFYGGLDQWEKICFGYCLMQGDQILSEATVGPSANRLYEPGVITRQDQRGRGYETMVTARLIQEIEAMGGHTYWNCARQNSASIALVIKLGYRRQKEFRCMLWKKCEHEGRNSDN